MPISTLRAVGQGEELIDEPAKPGKCGPAPTLLQQLEQQPAPKTQRNLVSQVIGSVLTQANR